MNKQPNSNDEGKRLKAILETAVDAIVCINSKGIVDSYNLAAEKMFGYSEDEIIGANISMLMPEPYASEHDDYIRHYEKTGEKKVIGIGREVKAKRKDGSIFSVELAIGQAVLNGENIYTGFIRDITIRKEAEDELVAHRDHLEALVLERTHELFTANKKLECLAKLDSLTGLANRRHFDEMLKNEISRAARKNDPLSLLMCDIDYFKQYNDAYGHIAGDECLKKIGACFNVSFKRASESPSRYGGEEFAVILPDTESEEAMRLAEELRQAIAKLEIPHSDSKVSEHITISIGVATFNLDRQTRPDELIRAADEALYRAKEAGRDRVEVYDQKK